MEYLTVGISVIALLVSIWAIIKPARESTKSLYFQGLNLRIDALNAEIFSYYPEKENEEKCLHYLKLISQQKNNHICNQVKQSEISVCCTEIRRLLAKLSEKNTTNQGEILQIISQQISFIEADIKDFCYK